MRQPLIAAMIALLPAIALADQQNGDLNEMKAVLRSFGLDDNVIMAADCSRISDGVRWSIPKDGYPTMTSVSRGQTIEKDKILDAHLISPSTIRLHLDGANGIFDLDEKRSGDDLYVVIRNVHADGAVLVDNGIIKSTGTPTTEVHRCAAQQAPAQSKP